MGLDQETGRAEVELDHDLLPSTSSRHPLQDPPACPVLLTSLPTAPTPLFMQLQNCCPPWTQHSPKSLEGRPRACRTRTVSRQVPGTFACREKDRLLKENGPKETRAKGEAEATLEA